MWLFTQGLSNLKENWQEWLSCTSADPAIKMLLVTEVFMQENVC